MSEYNSLIGLIESDLIWCLKHQNDKPVDKDDNGDFNRGYCSGRISLIKDLLAEIKVLQVQERIDNEDY